MDSETLVVLGAQVSPGKGSLAWRQGSPTIPTAEVLFGQNLSSPKPTLGPDLQSSVSSAACTLPFDLLQGLGVVITTGSETQHPVEPSTLMAVTF